MYNAANNASSQLAQAIGAEDTSLTVLDGSSFPEPPFVVSIEDEIIEVGAKDGNTFSALVRGTEGTTPASHASGSRVENRFTAGTYQQVVSELDAHKAEDVTQVDGVHGFIYEEGNWTPAFGTAFDGVYGTQTGKYVRKGNEVTLYFILEATEFSYSDGSPTTILGLPFNVDPDYPTVANIAWYNSVATSKIIFEAVNPYPVLYGYKYETSRSTLRPADIGTNFYIKGTISFRILT